MEYKKDREVYEKIKDDPSLQYLGVNGFKGHVIRVDEHKLTKADKKYFTDVFKQIYNHESKRNLKDGESPVDNPSSLGMYDGIEYKSKSVHFPDILYQLKLTVEEK